MFVVRPRHVLMATVLIVNLLLDQDKVKRMVIDGVVDAEDYFACPPIFFVSSLVFAHSNSVSIMVQKPSGHRQNYATFFRWMWSSRSI